MKTMKTTLLLLTALVLLASMPFTLAARAEPTRFLTLVAVNFPAYDFARQIAGEHADVRLLLPPGSESHSYEPTPQDIISIQDADLFLYTGGESDHWVEEILLSMGENAPLAFRMMDCVTALTEETSASMEHSHEDSPEMDEHVWTSPQNVVLIADELRRVLCELAPDASQAFDSSYADYAAQLNELDAAFEKVVAGGRRDIIVFGDRFPFRYFAASYNLRYDAAFPGCSEDSEPSARTVISLVDEVRSEGVPVVFYLEFSSRKTADIIAEETGAKPLLFHSCHNVSADELENGATYLSLMWGNVEALREALS